MASMTLREHIEALGHSSGSFLHLIDLPLGLMRTVENDKAIAKSYADKICKKLSEEFGRPIQLTDIKNLKTC
jgi:hypothetical protein